MTDKYRSWRGIGGVNKCSGFYKGADFAGGNVLPFGRLAYVAKVKSLASGFNGSLQSARAISAARNAIKYEFRGGGIFGGQVSRFSTWLLRDPIDAASLAQKTAKYGDDAALIASKATSTNPYFNSLAAATVLNRADDAFGSGAECGCQ